MSPFLGFVELACHGLTEALNTVSMTECESLGFGQPVLVSAEHGVKLECGWGVTLSGTQDGLGELCVLLEPLSVRAELWGTSMAAERQSEFAPSNADGPLMVAFPLWKFS